MWPQQQQPTAHGRSAAHRPVPRPGTPEDWRFGATATAAADGRGGGSPDKGEADPGRPECWICRDSSTGEPLVQPCRCRGSMAGVHASCVEAWVRSHRQDAEHEPPHCPVCRMRYGGREQRPGPQALAWQLSGSLARQVARTAGEAARFVLLGTLLVHYRALERDNNGTIDMDDEPSPVREAPGHSTPIARALAALALAAFMLHKLGVLSVSLPPHRPPPRGRLAQCFFTADMWCTARHVAELLAAVVLLGARCACGELPVAYFIPVVVGAVAPFVQLLLWYPVTACLREVTLFFVFLVCAPVLAVFEVSRLIWKHRRRLANPLDGPPHVALALTAILLCFLYRSRRPTMVLFLGHSVLLALGLLECLALRRLPWRSGHAWWCAVLVAIEATNIVIGRWWLTLLLLLVALRSLQRAAARPRPHGLFQGPLWWCTLLVVSEATSLGLHELRGPPVPALAAGMLAGAWLFLLGGLACAVNWRRCLRHYRGWQRQHATFVLCAPVLGSVGAEDGREEETTSSAFDVV